MKRETKLVGLKAFQQAQLFLALIFLALICLNDAKGDTLVIPGAEPLSGKILQTNGNNILLLMDYAAFNVSRSIIKEIKIDSKKSGDIGSTTRIPGFYQVVLALSKQPWALDLSPIPSTVIDTGVFKNVPYSSFTCGKDYEVNIYGKPDHPAGIEIGIYRGLLGNSAAKSNCIGLIDALLSDGSDKEVLNSLDWKNDLKTWEDITFEITPPSAPDAYNGWWVSVYSEKELNDSRASEEELSAITLSNAEPSKELERVEPFSTWSAEDLKLARSTPATISFTTSSGLKVTNAQVLRILDGISLIWRNETGSGSVRLADLPADLRTRFGYDPVKEDSAEKKEQQRLAQVRETHAAEVQAARNAEAERSTLQSSVIDTSASSAGYSYSGGSSGGGGRVYVHGYTRSNGTYVAAHTRSAPHRR
jgi:hypothetical protein